MEKQLIFAALDTTMQTFFQLWNYTGDSKLEQSRVFIAYGGARAMLDLAKTVEPEHENVAKATLMLHDAETQMLNAGIILS